MAKKPSVFISYSHEDEEWKDALRVHLDALQAEDENFVEPWDDRRIGAGENWKEEIAAAMDRASVAVLLVSAHFLTSKFILREEVPRLRERKRSGLRIVPVIVRPCNWQRVAWLSELEVRPQDGHPLLLGSEAQIETDCMEISREIADILDNLARNPLQPIPTLPEVSDQSRAAEARLAATPIAREAKKADAAVREVTDLAATGETGELLERFRRDLKAASNAIVAVTTYKELHDELHTFESDAYIGILNEHSRIDKDARARQNLETSTNTLLATIFQVRAFAERLAARNREMEWIERLEQAHRLLLDSLKMESVARAAAAVLLLTRVLDVELGRLNEVMVSHGKELGVSVTPVTQALEFVHEHAVALRIEPERENKVREGIAAFEQLIEGFMALITEHDRWQTIESELRIIENSPAASVEQLQILWPELKKKVEPTLGGRRDAWVTKLQTLLVALDGALASSQTPAAESRELFARFRRTSGKHFLFIDDQLREQCGKLANVDESLQLLIRMIDIKDQNEHHHR